MDLQPLENLDHAHKSNRVIGNNAMIEGQKEISCRTIPDGSLVI